MVNQAWVRRYLPGREVVGRRIRLDSKKNGEWRTIVGVVADAMEYGLDRPAPPVYYFDALQDPAPDMMGIVARGSVAPAALREALLRVDPTQPVDRVLPATEILLSSLKARRFPLQLLAAFAALALVLSALGIYGLTSYAVAQRTREIGLRMAIGASPLEVVGMVLGGSLRVVLFGLCAGAAGALAGARLIASQLYGIGARDPLTFLAIAALLSAVAVVASAIPALRAARIDPMSALRTE
jgi:putative ABC transport system permease protein